MARKVHYSWIDDNARAAGNIFYRGTPKDDTFHGKSGDDQIFGADGDDKLYGDKGNDHLTGQNDKDKLFGEAGYDVLDGGKGDDQLKGGSGGDAFEFSKKYGKDVILDFELGNLFDHDAVDLGSLNNIGTFENLVGYMKQDGKDILIDFGGGDILTLKNVMIEELQSFNFSIW